MVKYDVSTGSVVKRTHVFHIPVRCALSRDGVASQPVIPATQSAPPQISVGSFNVDLFIYKVRRLFYKNLVNIFNAVVCNGNQGVRY